MPFSGAPAIAERVKISLASNQRFVKMTSIVKCPAAALEWRVSVVICFL